MKTQLSQLKGRLLVLLFVAVGLCFGASGDNANTKDIALRVWGNGNQFYPWIHQGKIVTYEISTPRAFYCFTVYDQNETTWPANLAGSLGAVSSLIDKQIDPKERRDFVAKTLPDFLVGVLPSESTRLINPNYIQEYAKVLTMDNSDPKLVGDAASLALLKGVASEPEVSFDKLIWTIKMNVVIKLDGRVERWILSGSLDKFLIRNWNREILIEPGKIKLFSSTGIIY